MNLVEVFANYLQDTLGLGTIGEDLLLSNAPSSNRKKDRLWWLVASGGEKETTMVTGGSMKNYRIDIFHRDLDYKAVYNAMQALEIELNCSDCVQLEGYEVIRLEAVNLPIDNDIDDERRKVGLLQVNIRVYKER